jgi:hypothetical protein
MKTIEKINQLPGYDYPYVLHGNIEPLIKTINELVDAVNGLQERRRTNNIKTR